MEIVGNVGKTNTFHDLFVGNHGNCWFYQQFSTISMIAGTMARTFSTFREIVGNVGKTNNFHDLSVVNHANCCGESCKLLVLPAISMIPETMAPAP